jgi:uncharacterized membrane protein
MINIIILAIIMLILDGVYLFIFGSSFRKMISSIQHSNFTIRIISVILCYIILVFGLYYFIIKDNKTLFEAFLLGFVIYGVYDTTNYATFTNWKWNLALLDTMWGGILFALTTYLYKIVYN